MLFATAAQLSRSLFETTAPFVAGWSTSQPAWAVGVTARASSATQIALVTLLMTDAPFRLWSTGPRGAPAHAVRDTLQERHVLYGLAVGHAIHVAVPESLDPEHDGVQCPRRIERASAREPYLVAHLEIDEL